MVAQRQTVVREYWRALSATLAGLLVPGRKRRVLLGQFKAKLHALDAGGDGIANYMEQPSHGFE